MRSLYTIILGAAVLTSTCISASAQQLSNGSFEGDWVTCYPWTSNNYNKSQGTEPEGWVISNVVGVSAGILAGQGKTTVGSEVTPGYESDKAVKLANQKVMGNNIPAYISLGTTWSTATGVTGSNKDGGTFGGTDFTFRPDAIALDYIYTTGEKASVISYLWKGSWSQADVPGNIVTSGSTTKVTMVNRDRCVLGTHGPGLDGCQGGEVTVDGGELIAFTNDFITGNNTEWTTYTKELEYLTDDTPEMLNIIISADDYFGSTVTEGNEITIDNVRFIYYSRLASLKAGENEIALEDGKYEYDVDDLMPAENDFSFLALGKGAKATLALDNDNNKATVTVTNDGADSDGETSHVYTLNFKAAPEEEEGEPELYTGKIVIRMGGEDADPTDPINATISITPTGEDLCRFELPDFSLGEGMRIGDIVVNNVKVTAAADGTKSYSGSVEKMKLSDQEGDAFYEMGGIIADVNISGTISASGVVNMKIDVIWYTDPTNPDGEKMPIYVTFTDDRSNLIEGVLVDNNAPVEYFNLQGQRIAAESVTPGIYVRRQGNTVAKVLVK